MEILTSVKKIVSHNEKSGEICFYASNDVLYHGISQYLPVKCPIKLTISNETASPVEFKAIECYCETAALAIDFLSSPYFFGMGKASAEKFVSTYGAKIFSVDKSSCDESDKQVANKLEFLKGFEPVFEYISKRGGSYFLSHITYLKYGANTLKEIENNPYVLLSFDNDSDYAFCERLAYEYGIPMHDKRRLRALVRLALMHNHDSGNTRILFKDLVDIAHRAEGKSKLYLTPPLFIMETLIKLKAVLEQKNGDCYVYLKGDYISESRIVGAIRRLKNSSVQLKTDSLPIEEIEKRYHIRYSSEQKEAFEAIKSSGIKIITGGPGTGKTTVLNGMLEKYQANNPGAEIVLCAPTGCAARRMKEATGRDASTIHKLLSIKPYNDAEKDIVQKLNADCLIVDEVSMVDSLLMARLLSAVKNGALVILLGDPDQLPSVSAGNVLHDFIDCGVINTYRLKEVFRQAGHNPIIINSSCVASGRKTLKMDDSFRIYRVSNEESLVNAALKVAKRSSKMNIYTAARKTKFNAGTISLNRAIQKQNALAGSFIEYGYFRFYVGDRVMFTRNNYSLNYFNGEEGVITHVSKTAGRGKLIVRTEEEDIELSGEQLNDIELSYVITAHKSQGSECDNALILLPKNPRIMLRRQLLYVEITRAKKNVIIISENDALENCIDNEMAVERNTGLVEKLKNYK